MTALFNLISNFFFTRLRRRAPISLGLALALCLITATNLWALTWPADSDWHHLTAFSSATAQPTWDVTSDGQGSRDIVGGDLGGTNYPAAYTYNDGNYIYYRIRLNDDPRDNTGQGLHPFGWGFLVDTDGDLGDYEYMVMLDGINNPDAIYLAQNTQKTDIGDPSDHAETVVWQQDLDNDPSSGNYQVVLADSTFATNQTNPDYFLDYRMPYDIFKATLGIQDDSLIRYFVGSSNNAQSLTADLTAGAIRNADVTIPDGVSDFVLPSGTPPADGSIAFVTDLSGNTDLSEIYPGDTAYLRVDDDDQNSQPSEVEYISVTITAPSGDTELVTLQETGADTGIFTAPLDTEAAAASANDGTLQVSPTEFVIATYIDAADSDLNQQLVRSDTLKILPAADIGLSKSVNTPTPNEGATIVYTITATNFGPSTAFGIQVTDQLQSGVTYSSDDGNGSYNSVTGIWAVNTLAVGASTTLNLTASVDSGTSLSIINNDASVSAAAQVDLNPANDSASANIAVTGADIAIAQTISSASATPAPGDSVTFEITVTNNGLNDATSLILADLLTAGELTYVSDDSGGSYNPATGEWSIGTLINGATQVLQITATVAAPVGAVVNNTASVQSVDQGDPDSSNNSATVTFYVDGADLALSKSVDNVTPDEGDSIVYTLTLTNNGANSQSSILVEDILPAGVSFVSAAGSGSYDSATGVWDVGTLAATAGSNQVSLQITATINSGAAGRTITNSAAITSPAASTDPDLSNNSASVDINVDYVDLAIVKTVDNSSPQNGDSIVFTLTVTNNGPDDATGVSVYDALAQQLSYTSSSSPQGGTYSDASGIWNIGNLNVGASASLTINADVSIGNQDPPSFFNLASIHQLDQGDPISGNDASSVLLGVSGTDIAVTKSVAPTAPSTGDQVTYTVTVINNGPNDATNLLISEVLPTGLSYVSSADDYVPAGTDNTSYDSGKGEWSLGYKSGGSTIFPRGVTATLTVVADVTAASGSVIVNTAFVKSLNEADTNPANNSGQATIWVGGTDLGVSMTVDNATPTIGETVAFTVTLTNNGPNSASGIQLQDLLPSDLLYASQTAEPGSSYDQVSGLWDLSALTINSGATATLVINATIGPGTGGMTLTNTASISAGAALDSNASNDSASQSVVAQEADLAVAITVDNATPNVNDTVVYTVTVTNYGPQDATGVQISDLLPAGVTYIAPAVAEPGTSYNDVTGVWDLSAITLAKSTTATLLLTATVDSDQGGLTITNSASISASGLYDPNSANNSANIAISPFSPANLTMLKTANKATAQPGDIITYTLQVTNTGNGAGTGIEVNDDMSPYADLILDPFGTGDFYMFSNPSGDLTPGTPVFTTGPDGDIILWELPIDGAMRKDDSFTLIYQATVE